MTHMLCSPSDPARFEARLTGFAFAEDTLPRVDGAHVTLDWVEETAFAQPVVVDRNAMAMGLRLPPPSVRARDIAEKVGPHRAVDVIDVRAQRPLDGWTLRAWAEYFDRPAPRAQILNLSTSTQLHVCHRRAANTQRSPRLHCCTVSLEFSGTELERDVAAPLIVRQLDWVRSSWPEVCAATPRQPASCPR